MIKCHILVDAEMWYHHLAILIMWKYFHLCSFPDGLMEMSPFIKLTVAASSNGCFIIFILKNSI